MTRSLTLSSVWFAACAWILGNLLHLAVGGLMLLSLFLPHAHPGSRLVTTIASISAAAFGGTGVAGILTGIAALQQYRVTVTIGTQVLARAILLGWRGRFFDSVPATIPPTTRDAIPEKLLP